MVSQLKNAPANAAQKSGFDAMPVCGILFDKDGTLIDFQRTWGPATYEVIYTLAGGNAMHIAEIAQLSHYDLEQRTFAATSPLVAGSSEDFAKGWAKVLGVTADEAFLTRIDQLTTRFGADCAVAMPDTHATLAALRARKIVLGVATNDSEASARAQLASMGLGSHFDFVAGYDSGHGSKPGPGMIDAFVKTLKVPAAKVMMVGDSLHDLAAARAAGVIAAGVTTGFASHDELSPHADLVISSLAELISRLDGETFGGLPSYRGKEKTLR